MTNMDEAARRLIEIERSKRVLADAREMLAADPRSAFLRLVVEVMEGRIIRISSGGCFESMTIGGRFRRASMNKPMREDELLPAPELEGANHI